MYANEIRQQAENATRAALPTILSALWGAFADGKITEAEAETLARVIMERQHAAVDYRASPRTGDAVPLADAPIVRHHGSRPRTDASMGRRRTWAASGRLPPALAARFTQAEVAVLAVVAVEVAKGGDCRLAVGHLAALAGVSETSVRNALREARTFGLVTVEARRVTGYRNSTNVVRIVSPEWQAWMRLARRETRLPAGGGGCRSPEGTNTGMVTAWKTGPSERLQEAVGEGRHRHRHGLAGSLPRSRSRL